MAKVIMTCGKICVGKSTYAKKLCREDNAALLSVDEIMLAVFGQDAGDRHDEYVRKIQKFLMEKSCELADCGVNAVLDWGLWSREEREDARRFYSEHNIAMEIHYLDISNEEWKRRIEKRNRLVEEGESEAYYVDERLVKKLLSLFEKPERDEVDMWYMNA